MNDILFTIVGYVVFTVFTVGFMALGMLVEKKTALDGTMVRKVTHIVSSLTWIICYFFFGCSLHWVILNGIGAVVIGIATFSGVLKSYYKDGPEMGIFYFGLSTFIVALICYLIGEEVYLYTGIAYYCLSLGDGFAPIVAKLLKKFNLQIMPGKSLFGSLTVFVVSFLSVLTFSAVFHMELGLLFMFSVASLTCVVEFYGLRGIDNILIEFSVFGYMLLYHFGFVSLTFEIVVTASPFLAMLAIASKSLTVSGGICGLFLFYVIGFFGRGYVPVLFLASMFVIASVVSAVTHRLYSRQNGGVAMKFTRTGKQVVGVGAISALCLVIYYFTGIQYFYAMFFLGIAEQFADSMASDIGRLDKGKNVDIIRFKPVEKGISGGVSVLGTSCALVSSFLLLLFPLLFRILEWKYYLVLSAVAFLGTLIDSAFGSLFQALYYCPACGEKTEDSSHCDGKPKLIKGFPLIGNVSVNVLSGFATCAFGCFILLL